MALTVFPKFEFYVQGKYQGMPKRIFSPFRPQYDVDFKGWHVTGNFMNLNRGIRDENNRQIAAIDRELLHLHDNYVIDVNHDEDSLYCLQSFLRE